MLIALFLPLVINTTANATPAPVVTPPPVRADSFVAPPGDTVPLTMEMAQKVSAANKVAFPTDTSELVNLNPAVLMKINGLSDAANFTQLSGAMYELFHAVILSSATRKAAVQQQGFTPEQLAGNDERFFMAYLCALAITSEAGGPLQTPPTVAEIAAQIAQEPQAKGLSAEDVAFALAHMNDLKAIKLDVSMFPGLTDEAMLKMGK